MKNNVLFILLFTSASFLISACNSDNDPDGVDELVGTYVGSMNVDTPSFQNVQYAVTVSKINSSRVRMSPSGSAGSIWEANLTNIAGVYTCISCVSQNQITFTKVNGNYQLAYNYDSNNEQFAGSKQ